MSKVVQDLSRALVEKRLEEKVDELVDLRDEQVRLVTEIRDCFIEYQRTTEETLRALRANDKEN